MKYPFGTLTTELAHHGILGQKWGVRRFQNKDGSLTNAGKNRYKATKKDIDIYGKKGAERIANRRNKGDSLSTARKKETGLQITKGLALTTAVYGGLFLTEAYGSKAVKAGKSVVDNYMNTSIFDSDGNVVKRYHSAVKTGREVCMALMRS